MADIVIAYCEPIDTSLVTSKQHFINYLSSKGHRILYLESPPTTLSFLRYFRYYWRQGLSRFFRLESVKQNVWSFRGFYFLPFHRGFFDRVFLNKINQELMSFFLKRVYKKLGFKKPYYIMYYPNLLPVLDSLGAERVLFHIVDNWEGMPGMPKSFHKMIQDMLRRADVSVVSANELKKQYESSAKNTMHLLHHGAHLDVFKNVYHEKLSANISDPNAEITVGYYGALHKLNYSLIANVAKQKPNWHFVFHGPIDGLQGLGAELPELPANVQLKESIEYQSLPAFLASIDVFWMPFATNPAMHAMCSIKIFEIAAAGLPAVITSLRESVRIASPFYYEFAESAKEHEAALVSVLKCETSERQQARHVAVQAHDWQTIAETFESYLLGFSASVNNMKPSRENSDV